jgi:hypothetical protein
LGASNVKEKTLKSNRKLWPAALRPPEDLVDTNGELIPLETVYFECPQCGLENVILGLPGGRFVCLEQGVEFIELSGRPPYQGEE